MVAGQHDAPSWDEDERFEIIDHLQHTMVSRAYMGASRCRFCGVLNGTLDLTDGTYVWPEGLAHYLREHHVRLPQELVDHVPACSARWEDAEALSRLVARAREVWRIGWSQFSVDAW